jgi:hypothetical protein
MIYVITNLQEIPKTCCDDIHDPVCPFYNDEYDCCNALTGSRTYEQDKEPGRIGNTRRASFCPLRDTNTEGEFR